MCVWCEKKTGPNIIAKGHADVRGIYCHYLPRGCTWSCGIKKELLCNSKKYISDLKNLNNNVKSSGDTSRHVQ